MNERFPLSLTATTGVEPACLTFRLPPALRTSRFISTVSLEEGRLTQLAKAPPVGKKSTLMFTVNANVNIDVHVNFNVYVNSLYSRPTFNVNDNFHCECSLLLVL